jgi:hypothetical protein
MRRAYVSAERVLDAPAAVVYHCIADYREHHRTEGFLPPVFTDLQVEQGGVGAGTVIRFTMNLGGRRRTAVARVTEPQPGRVLVETGGGALTTFTVLPEGDRARVRFDTVLEGSGLEGLMLQLFGARLLRPVYEDELTRLEAAARRHPLPLAPAAGPAVARGAAAAAGVSPAA